jgi:hypothetical protein
MKECKRDVGPWKTHPKRMLRHKALIQCARLAFGFVGIYDQDEAERIIENTKPLTEIDTKTGEVIDKPEKPALEYCSDANFDKNQESWYKLVSTGKKTPEQLINTLETKYLLTDEQKLTIDSWSHESD